MNVKSSPGYELGKYVIKFSEKTLRASKDSKDCDQPISYSS